MSYRIEYETLNYLMNRSNSVSSVKRYTINSVCAKDRPDRGCKEHIRLN